jgi:hypothetical protein
VHVFPYNKRDSSFAQQWVLTQAFFSYQKRVVPLLSNGCTYKYEFSYANSSKIPPQRSQMKDQLGLSNLLARADGCTAESKLENGFPAETFAQLFRALSKIIFCSKKWNSYRSHSWRESCSDTTAISQIQFKQKFSSKIDKHRNNQQISSLNP